MDMPPQHLEQQQASDDLLNDLMAQIGRGAMERAQLTAHIKRLERQAAAAAQLVASLQSQIKAEQMTADDRRNAAEAAIDAARAGAVHEFPEAAKAAKAKTG
jgi:hypothetical protein